MAGWQRMNHPQLGDSCRHPPPQATLLTLGRSCHGPRPVGVGSFPLLCLELFLSSE